MGERPWSVVPDGVVVAVRLTPKGGRDAIDGVERLTDGRMVLKARVRAAASEGEANAALVRLLARALGVPGSRVEIVAGRAARTKRLRVAGDAPRLVAALDELLPAPARRTGG